MVKNAVAAETVAERADSPGNGLHTVPTDAADSMMEAPRGTVTLMAIFGVFIIVLWGFMYILMLMRG